MKKYFYHVSYSFKHRITGTGFGHITINLNEPITTQEHTEAIMHWIIDHNNESMKGDCLGVVILNFIFLRTDETPTPDEDKRA